jgi:hypothetical protein
MVEPAQGSPTEIVKAAVAALEAERWGDLLPLVPQEAVQRFRDTRLHSLIESETRPARTVEQVLAEQPWLPREVAAYHAEQEERHVRAGLPARLAEWGVSSFRELEALSPAEFFVRYLAASSPAAKLRVAIAVSPKPPKDPARALGEAASPKIIVLGEVGEGSIHAHVLYRQLHDPTEVYDPEHPAGHVSVTHLDFGEGRWWLRIDHTLLDPQGWMMVCAPDDSGAPIAED